MLRVLASREGVLSLGDKQSLQLGLIDAQGEMRSKKEGRNRLLVEEGFLTRAS